MAMSIIDQLTDTFDPTKYKDTYREDLVKMIKQKAAEKLRILINQYPDDIALRGKLALLYYENGFTDAAGKYWIFTEPSQDHIQKAVEIYRKSVNNSSHKILQDIKFRGDRAQLSAYPKMILEELEKDKASVSLKSRKAHINLQKQDSFSTSLSEIGCYTVLIIMVLIFIAGLMSVVKIIENIFF